MYTSNSGMPEFAQRTLPLPENEYKVDYDPTTELLITVGCSEALDLTMRAIVDPAMNNYPESVFCGLQQLRHADRRQAD